MTRPCIYKRDNLCTLTRIHSETRFPLINHIKQPCPTSSSPSNTALIGSHTNLKCYSFSFKRPPTIKFFFSIFYDWCVEPSQYLSTQGHVLNKGSTVHALFCDVNLVNTRWAFYHCRDILSNTFSGEVIVVFRQFNIDYPSLSNSCGMIVTLTAIHIHKEMVAPLLTRGVHATFA